MCINDCDDTCHNVSCSIRLTKNGGGGVVSDLLKMIEKIVLLAKIVPLSQ